MLTALDAPSTQLDAQEQKVVDNIRMHGWFNTSVFGDESGPGFSYTTGFWVSVGFPELIVFSLKRKTAHDIFWDIYRDLQSGKTPPVGRATPDLLGGGNAALISVAEAHYPAYLGWNRWFYGGDGFPCLHLIWPDASGKFPWQPGFDDRFLRDQPDLTQHGWISALVN